MRKIAKVFTLLLVVVAFAAPSKSFAQDGKKNVFKVNLLSPIVGSYNFFYERALGSKTSLQLGGGFVSLTASGTGITGFSVTPEFRFYPSGNSPKGFYLAPFGRYNSLSLTVTDNGGNEGKATLTSIGAGLSIGRQWIFGDIVALDIFAGPVFNASSNVTVETSGFAEDNFSTGNFSGGVGVRFGLTLGVAF
ncbi:DUF3575 domain-containing protein [uncultured Microscilla sp.]|uniref:DUF3575 domain-containing protein n=1 Tax=uncultured Microscilla sp. TaxID=432653 RepID=UPI0026077F0E|nr:DUF3575 domain-containing protein [uncultured Microscilla sp.]